MGSVLGLYQEFGKEEVEIMIKFTQKPICPKCGNTKGLKIRYRAASSLTISWFTQTVFLPECILVTCPVYGDYGCGHEFEMECKDRNCQY